MAQQNQATGAAANRYGRQCAQRIAQAIGAQMVRPGSNEIVYNGQREVIKCAHANTTKVGVSHLMLQHLNAVLGAFEISPRLYRLVHLSAADYSANMTPTRSTGPSANRVGIVEREVFNRMGHFMRNVRV